jgi:hypothetical protein
MLTDNDIFELDDRRKPPDWGEIEELLSFAEELKTKCDEFSDRMFLLDMFQAFSSFIAIAITVVAIAFFHFAGFSFFDILVGQYVSWIGIFLLFFPVVLIVFTVASEMYARKIRRRIRSDLRALDSIVYLLRENHDLITATFSELQKIHLRIKLSRFDIETSIPIPLFMKIIRLFYFSPGYRNGYRKL